MRTPLPGRLGYLGVIALTAAAIGDPLVESISNTGVFGSAYRDDNHLGIVPALLAALAVALCLAWHRCAAVVRASRERGDWLAEVAALAAARSPLRDAPAVYVLQLAAVFAIERLEVTLGSGLHDGSSWLGGPAAFSLALHALVCLACAVLAARIGRWVVTGLAALVGAALRFVRRSRSHAPLGRASAPAFARVARAQDPHVRQRGGRAPPLRAIESST